MTKRRAKELLRTPAAFNLDSFHPSIAKYPISWIGAWSQIYGMEIDREQSPRQTEQPVNSIENESSVTDEQWNAMMDVTMGIYEFREAE